MSLGEKATPQKPIITQAIKRNGSSNFPLRAIFIEVPMYDLKTRTLVQLYGHWLSLSLPSPHSCCRVA